jgi:hypothetical protein
MLGSAAAAWMKVMSGVPVTGCVVTRQSAS